MSFGFSLFAAFFLLSLGGAFGCLVCMVFGAVFHQKVLKTRLTIFCLLLSVAVATVAFVLIFAPALVSSVVPVAREHLAFLSILFAIGFLCAVFWRTVLPFVVICYIALSVFTGVKLYGAFGANEETLSVAVNATTIKVNDAVFSVDAPQEKSIVLKTYALPAELLLPLPRVWYTPVGVADTASFASVTADVDSLAHFSGDAPSAVVFSGESDKSFFGGLILRYRRWLLNALTYRPIPLPNAAVFPSIYSVHIETFGENLSASVTRNL